MEGMTAAAVNENEALAILAEPNVIAVGALLIAPSLFKRPGVVALALLLGVAPIALNLVLLVASRHQPYVDWGNPESLPALWNHMTRGQYSGMETEHRAASSYADYLRRLGNLWHWMTRQFGGTWVLLLPALGFLPLTFRQTGLWLYLTISSLLCTIGVTRYMQYEFGREHLYAVTMFWIPPAMTLAWYAAGALDVLLLADRRMLQLSRPATRRAATAGAVVALSALVAVPAVRDYRLSDRSGTTLIRDFGHALLSVMEPGALYFPSSDHSTFSVLYQQGVLGYRTDVTLADKYGRIEYVAAAYNAGPNRVVQWRASLPLQMDEWQEEVPFRETRLYIQGVVRNTLQYKRLYDENGNFRPEVGSRAVYASPSASPSPADTIKMRRVIGEEED